MVTAKNMMPNLLLSLLSSVVLVYIGIKNKEFGAALQARSKLLG